MRTQRKISGTNNPMSGIENTILRDRLAHDRTMLALERTLLAYVRTFFILLTAGITFLKIFSSDSFFLITGIVLLPLGVAFLIFGTLRFFLLRSKLKNLMK